jgi:glycosyltransferase involved in cell wall biosynthesis
MSNGVSRPLVSICIPAFNAGNTIRETIRSLLEQSYSNIEIHISDNASTDNTIEAVSEFKDSRITIHENEVNVGGEENFNICLHLARGKYTAIFHADDIYEPTMIETQVEFLERNRSAGAVFTQANLINESGARIGEIRLPSALRSSTNLYDFDAVFKALLQESNFLICPSVMARTQIYQQDMRAWRWALFESSADLDMWLRIAQEHQIGILPTPLMRVRLSDEQWSAKVRLQPNRADFFKVVDYYLLQKNVQTSLSKLDNLNYLRLIRRDNIMRAANLFLIGNLYESRQLLGGLYSFDTLCAALQHKRNFLVLLLGTYLHLLHFFKLRNFGQRTLRFMKHILRK